MYMENNSFTDDYLNKHPIVGEFFVQMQYNFARSLVIHLDISLLLVWQIITGK